MRSRKRKVTSLGFVPSVGSKDGGSFKKEPVWKVSRLGTLNQLSEGGIQGHLDEVEEASLTSATSIGKSDDRTSRPVVTATLDPA